MASLFMHQHFTLSLVRYIAALMSSESWFTGLCFLRSSSFPTMIVSMRTSMTICLLPAFAIHPSPACSTRTIFITNSFLQYIITHPNGQNKTDSLNRSSCRQVWRDRSRAQVPLPTAPFLPCVRGSGKKHKLLRFARHPMVSWSFPASVPTFPCTPSSGLTGRVKSATVVKRLSAIFSNTRLPGLA